jgi:hypothetical protein
MYLTQVQENLGIEMRLCREWGYQLDSSGSLFPKLEGARREGIRVNPAITPIDAHCRLVEPSARLQELNKEIEQMELMKKINERRGREGKEVDSISLVNELIKSYNSLLDPQQSLNGQPQDKSRGKK